MCTTGIDLRVAIKHSRSFNSQHLQLRSCFCVVIIIIFNRSTVAVALCYLCILFLLFFLLIMLFQHNRIKYYARILRVHTVRSNTTSSSLMASLSFSSHHKLNHNRVYIYIYMSVWIIIFCWLQLILKHQLGNFVLINCSCSLTTDVYGTCNARRRKGEGKNLKKSFSYFLSVSLTLSITVYSLIVIFSPTPPHLYKQNE